MKKDNITNLISIIIPIYNSEKFLKQCLDSILNQSYQNFEAILVCDKSEDNSADICEEYAKKHNNIKYICRENASGVSSARNCGLDNLSEKSEFVCFIDADDWIEPEYLETLLINIIQYNADISVCSWEKSYRTKKHFAVIKNPELTFCSIDKAISEMLLCKKVCGACWNKLFRTKILGEQKFNENIFYGEDTLFCFTYMQKCENCIITSKKLYHYIKNKNSAVSKKYTPKRVSILDALKNIVDLSDSTNVEVYARSWYFLCAVELLMLVKMSNVKNLSLKERLKTVIKENYYSFIKIKKNYPSFFTRLGGVMANILVKDLRKNKQAS